MTTSQKRSPERTGQETLEHAAAEFGRFLGGLLLDILAGGIGSVLLAATANFAVLLIHDLWIPALPTVSFRNALAITMIVKFGVSIWWIGHTAYVEHQKERAAERAARRRLAAL